MKASRIVITILVVSSVLSAAALFMPTPITWTSGWLLFHCMFVMVIGYACFHVGTVILLLASLRRYKAKLRRAYTTIAVAISMLALSTLQVAVISTFNWWDSFWVNYGLIILPYLAAGVTSYLGARYVAQNLQIQTILARPLVVLPVITLFSLFILLVPHVLTAPPIIDDASNVLLVWTTLMYVAAGIVIRVVTKHSGGYYKDTIGWLGLGFVVSGVLLGAELIHSLFSIETQDLIGILIDPIGLLAAVLFLRAGYQFAKSIAGKIGTALGMATYAISLASHPSDIRSLINQVHAITDALPLGQTPSLTDNQKLVNLYLGIEQYLLTKEPIRAFTKEELRARFDPILQELLYQRENQQKSS